MMGTTISARKITHVLKDGTRLAEISGHIVREKDAPTVYAIMNNMNITKMNRKEIEK